MKIGVMSDTHGHLDLMRRAAAKMVNDYRATTIVHLGDDSTDADELASLSVDVVSVPGIYEARYKDPSIPNRLIRKFEGVPFLLSHTPRMDGRDLPGDIDPVEAMEDGDVRVVLHGHSHIWRIDEEKGVIVINPGHLVPKGSYASKGREPTFAVLDLTERKLDVKIFSAEGARIAEKTFFFGI